MSVICRCDSVPGVDGPWHGYEAPASAKSPVKYTNDVLGACLGRVGRFFYVEDVTIIRMLHSTSIFMKFIAELYRRFGVAQLPSELPQGPAAFLAPELLTRTQLFPVT